MPFWKRARIPGISPVRRPQPRPAPDSGAETGQEENTAQELREMFRELGKGAREFFGMEEKEPEPEVPPQMCPWCGKEMERGYLLSGQWIYWAAQTACGPVPAGTCRRCPGNQYRRGHNGRLPNRLALRRV